MTTYTNPLGTFDSNTGDGGLGSSVLTNNDRPPLGAFAFGPAYDGTCFIIKDNRLYYSKPKRPEAWPSLYYIEVGAPQFPGKTGVFHGGQPHYFTQNEIYYIQGTGDGLFQPIQLEAKTGAQSARGAVSVAGKGIFHTGPDGLYLFANHRDSKITEDSLEPIFRGTTVNDMPGVATMSTSWLHHYKNKIYFGYSSTATGYPTNVITMNLESAKISYFKYNDGSDVEIRTITTDSTNQRLLVGDATGFIRVIESTSATDDSGTAISWEAQSKDYTLPTRRHFPRWVKYDIDASSATSVTGALLLDGSSHQTHTVTGNRLTKRRLVGTGNGNKAAIKLSGTGPTTIYSVEFE
jgi:hypothetical protein